MANRKWHINYIAVLILVGSFLLGFAVCALFGLQTVPHRQIVGTVVTPLRTAASAVGNAVSDFFSSFTRYRRLQAEHDELRLRYNELKNDYDETFDLRYEVDYLRGLLALSETEPDFSFTEARVVSRSADGWGTVFSLNEGTAAGISRGDVVVAGDGSSGTGLVGVISDVGLNWATVTCLIDPDFSAGALVVRTSDIAYTAGTQALRAEGLFMLTPLDALTLVNRGDVVVTSGLGGKLPKGLVLGTVRELHPNADGLSEYAVVEPVVDFSTVRVVYVITNFETEDVFQ